MFYSAPHRLIFVHISRTAGGTIRNELEAAIGRQQRDPRLKRLGVHPFASHISLLLGVDWDQYWSFSVVRNPWDRMVSLYFHRCKLKLVNKSFKSWLLDDEDNKPKKRTPQSRWLFEDGRQVVNKIHRFERLDKVERSIAKRIKRPFRFIRHVNKTKHNPYRDYYDDETRQLVASIFDEDIRNFGYIF